MDEHTIIAQANGVGTVFRIRMPVQKGAKEGGVFQEREVVVTIGFDEQLGRNCYYPLSRLPDDFDSSNLPEISLSELEEIDSNDITGSSLNNVRKAGSSRSGFSIEAQWENRGAEPGFKMPKTGGFNLKR